MAITPLIPIVKNFELTTAWQDVYTVSDNYARVALDKVTISNFSSNNATYSVRIAPDAIVTNDIITDKKVKSKRADLAMELSVHALERGAVLQMKASANSAFNVNITATQIS